ncbi:hypothetical protein CBA19CS22_38305 [Caballeronia novacaledonica]|uniref:Uncharacterized protein n=1 Tax=Caballeronia novacaledonica TaxID=1544861 RepID=A0ACB5R625_9BURK|nr:hypothetical protein CBA19CS22_38305 [Caballeronia novacaledonica]
MAQYNFNNQPTSLQLGFPVFPATHREWYLGFQVTIPFFEGFARTYHVRQAEAQTEVQVELLAEARQQVGLDVWNAYQSLQSATKNLDNGANLLTLAQHSYETALRRYQIGVGSILELLNAQSALANAKKQRIQSLTDWRSARLQLASKLGRFGVKTVRLYEKIALPRQRMRELEQIREQLKKEPARQLSLTDPDSRSITSGAKRTGTVGYNVQTVVHTKHHLIVEHEVTNVGSDRGQLSRMALSAKSAMGKANLKVLADRGYFSGPDIRACEQAGIKAYVPKPLSSSSRKKGAESTGRCNTSVPVRIRGKRR